MEFLTIVPVFWITEFKNYVRNAILGISGGEMAIFYLFVFQKYAILKKIIIIKFPNFHGYFIIPHLFSCNLRL